MILYRALNPVDIKNIKKKENINCSLVNVFKYFPKDKIKEKHNELYNKYFEKCLYESLNSMIDHVSFKSLKYNISPWISLSSNLEKTIAQFTTKGMNRKPVAVIEIKEEDIYSKLDELSTLKNVLLNDFAVDLREDNLKRLITTEIIKNDNYNDAISTKATLNEEFLAFKEIDLKNIKEIIFPFEQDIIFSTKMSLEEFNKHRKTIRKIYNSLPFILKGKYEFSKFLYPSYTEGTNLSDLATQGSLKYFSSVNHKYSFMKACKKYILYTVINILNEELNTDYSLVNLIDDFIEVQSVTDKSEIVGYPRIVEINNLIYKYDYKLEEYVKTCKSKQKIKRKEV